jgi:hypothetical protein
MEDVGRDRVSLERAASLIFAVPVGERRAVSGETPSKRKGHPVPPCAFVYRSSYSHSMVAGGFEEMSRATRLTSRISLMIRFETRSRRS